MAAAGPGLFDPVCSVVGAFGIGGGILARRDHSSGGGSPERADGLSAPG